MSLYSTCNTNQSIIPAFFTIVKYCLTFISRTKLHGMIFHFVVTTIGTLFFNLIQQIKKKKISSLLSMEII
jgi:hypothetical protein